MSLLRLAVLGAPEVFHDGSRLTFSLRKAQALLLYLAVEGGMHSRSKLAALLWPDSEPQAARTGLRTALTLLRGLCADSDASPSQPGHLLSRHELLGLNPRAPLELDLNVVQQAYQALRLSAVHTEQQRTDLVALFQHALSLARGIHNQELEARSLFLLGWIQLRGGTLRRPYALWKRPWRCMQFWATSRPLRGSFPLHTF